MGKGKMGSGKKLKSVAAPLESDSDDEFNSAALSAEVEASYKSKKRGRQPKLSSSPTKTNRKDVLSAIQVDPLPAMLGLVEPPLAAQTKLTETWKPIKSAPTEGDDTATESEEDDDATPSQVPRKRPSKCGPPSSPVKRAKSQTTVLVRTKSSNTDTATESESDEDPFPPSTASAGVSSAPPPSQPVYTPTDAKPHFAPPPDQAHLGPMILNSPNGNPAYTVQVPASINRQLRAYQREGVEFFHTRWAEGRGGLLGDDMGLGKTIQVISFLSAALRKSGTSSDAHRRRDRVRALQDEGLARADLPRADKKWPTVLIVCPKTVIGNWEKELEVWGYFEYGVYAGDKAVREDVVKDFTMGRLDIVLTAFDTARNHVDLLSSLPWSMIFVDEVHRCKNPSSGTTMALNKFACRVRFGLTGTAIQNGYKELWTLLDWCSPGKVGSQSQWKSNISLPLAEGQAHKATQAQVSRARLLAERLVQRVLPCFFLRRTKALIADQMPRKFDQVVFCPLAKTQLEVYKRFLECPDVQLMVRKDEPCDCGSEKKRGSCCHKHNAQGVPWKDLVLKYMMLFVEISNHVILICPGFKGETDEQRARRREYVKIAFPGQTVRQADLIHDDSLCGKWKVLSQLLDTWKTEGNNKVLIFSKSVKILEMLDEQLRRKSMQSLDKFNHDPEVFVFLISTLVGGTGLNMTSANKVVIFGKYFVNTVGNLTELTGTRPDPNWNPAHDLQAMDRAYRFGQKRDVNVYRLLGAGALEELIYARQIYKQQQMHIGYEASAQTRYFEGVQGSKDHQGELFGLKNIFRLHETALATKMIIEKANLAEINWALANMDATPDGTIKETSSSAERSLADFMLDDSQSAPIRDAISDVLNSAGVAYTHEHQNVLLASHVEKNITSTAIAGSKREIGEAVVTLANEGVPEKKPTPLWPPRRNPTAISAPAESMTRLEARVEALIELGLVKDQESLAAFGREFARMSEVEQRKILVQADQVSARRRASIRADTTPWTF